MSFQIAYDALAAELVRELRGTQSTRAASMRLGFASNTVQRWETGDRAAPADDVLRLAHLMGRPVERASYRLNSAVLALAQDLTPRDGAYVPTLVASFAETYGRPAMAAATGLSLHRIGRMIRGETRVRLADLLRIMFTMNRSLVPFLSDLSDLTALPSAEAAWVHRDRVHGLYRDMPFFASLLDALSTEAYTALPAHDDGAVARMLDLDPHDVSHAFNRARELGLVEAHEGRLRLPLHAVDTWLGLPRELAKHVAVHLLQRAADDIPHGTSTMAWRSFRAHPDDLAKIAHELGLGLDGVARTVTSREGDRIGYALVAMVSMDGKPILKAPNVTGA